MVDIPLDSKTVLSSDSRQWILLIDGRASKFFRTLQAALESYFEAKMRTSSAKSINTLLLRQKEIVAALNNALTPLKIKVESLKGSTVEEVLG